MKSGVGAGGLKFRAPNYIVGTTFAKCLSLWNAIFRDKGSWPHVNPSPHSIHPFHCLVGTLGWKHGWNRPRGCKLPTKQILPDVLLTIVMELDPPTILLCIVCIAHRAKRPLKAPAPIYFLFMVTLFPSLCSLRLLTLSPSLSMTPGDYWMLSNPRTMT